VEVYVDSFLTLGQDEGEWSALGLGCFKREYLATGIYRGADKYLARPGRKQVTATEDFDFDISYLKS
jgi:hypothetical protein